MALGACTWTGHGLSNVSMGATLPLVTSLLECYFFKLGFFFFFFQRRLFGKSACLSLGSISMGVALAFEVCLWELPWPWLCALAMTAMPMGIALILVVCFCDGCFLIGVVMALGACT